MPATTDSSQLALPQPYRTITVDDEEAEVGILARLRRRRLAFAGAFIASAALVGGVFAVAPRSYKAEANVILTSAEPILAPEGSNATPDPKEGDTADVESQMVVIDSINLLQKVGANPAVATLLEQECRLKKTQLIGQAMGLLERLGMITQTDCHDYASDPTAIAQYLQNKLVIGLNGKSRVINVDYSSPIPEASQTIPNAIIDAFIASKRQDRLDSRLAAVSWLRAELARISDDLSQTEARIATFNREHGLVRGQAASIDSEQLTAIGQQMVIARAAEADAASKLIQLTSGAASAPATLENRAVADIKQQLATVIGEQADMASSHGPSYPGLISLAQQRASLTAQLAAETAKIAASLRQDYASAKAQVSSLEKQLEEAKQQVAVGTDAETTIANLQRHADVQRELYVNLSIKVDALETERRVVTGNAQVVSYAQLPDKISFPRKLPFILGGLIVAIGAGVGASLMLDRGDKSVRTRRGLQLASGVPVLGYVPALRRTKLTGCRQVATDPALQEAIRGLYAQSVLMHGRKRPQSILVTSALTGEGKTFISLALAQFAARSGQRVLAIEADLRRPDFQRALTLQKIPGLSDYLRGNLICEDIVQHSQVAGLDVVIAGKPTLDSTELISNHRIGNLLSWAQGRYDLIVIDSPPAQALMDARLLASHVDGVIFCSRWGRSMTQEVSVAVQDLVQQGARVLGQVIDRVHTQKLRLYDQSSGYDMGYQPRVG